MKRFIGLIDSGMGGLTVLNQIIHSLPEENTVYFGDMGQDLLRFSIGILNRLCGT